MFHVRTFSQVRPAHGATAPHSASITVYHSTSLTRTYITNYPRMMQPGLYGVTITAAKSTKYGGYETIGIAKSNAEMEAHLEAVGGQESLGWDWGYKATSCTATSTETRASIQELKLPATTAT